jgi:hypothetical protein
MYCPAFYAHGYTLMRSCLLDSQSLLGSRYPEYRNSAFYQAYTELDGAKSHFGRERHNLDPAC